MNVVRPKASAYMRFAKLESGARYNLASSGLADISLAELGATIEDLELRGDNAYGYGPLARRIADRFGVDPACVVIPGGGCSFANHLAFASLIEPGDEVWLEDPGYELLGATLGYLQAQVRHFRRGPDGQLDLEAFASVSPHVRLIVLTNLHNPTSALATPQEIALVASAAGGANVLIDEVYLEMTFDAGRAHTAFGKHGNIIATSSLTKAYGLSGLRCGWILAPAPLAERMRRLNDLYAVHHPHVAEQLAVLAFDRLESLADRSRSIIARNRAAYREILGAAPGLIQTVPDQGASVFPRLREGDGDRFLRRLREKFETSVVPGRFFGRSDHIRIGLGGDPVESREGFFRVAEALAA